MTLLEIKTAAASYLKVTPTQFIINGQDLFLQAINEVRRQAELDYDFHFQEKLLTVSVDTITGGSLDLAVLYGTSTIVEIKTLVDIGLFDEFNNLLPAEWTTVDESMNRQRQEEPYRRVRYPSDGQVQSSACGLRRFTVINNSLYSFPKPQTGETLNVGLNAFIFSDDWTDLQSAASADGAVTPPGVHTTYYQYGTYNDHLLFLSVLTGVGATNPLYAIWSSGTTWYITPANMIGDTTNTYFSFVSTSQDPSGTYTAGASGSGSPVISYTPANSISDVWTTHGAQFLLWSTIIKLNHKFQSFVPRQEGVLAPPQAQADGGLQSLITWDSNKYELNRRHER